jgi:hypothetical protein
MKSSFEEMSVCNEFTRTHNLRLDLHDNEDRKLIYWLVKLKKQIDEDLRESDLNRLSINEPTWVILLSMLHRIFEHEESIIISFFTGAWASVEILARVVMESSVNVMYILDRDRAARLIQYFKYYFKNTKTSINRYMKLIESASDSDKAELKKVGERNRSILKRREESLFHVLKLDNIHSKTSTPWPNSVYNKFEVLGLELDYRTYYASLSSQVHDDADSLIDYILSQSIQVSDVSDKNIATKEIFNWIRLYSYLGLKYFTIAASKYSHAYGLTNSQQYSKSTENSIIDIIDDIQNHIFQLIQ